MVIACRGRFEEMHVRAHHIASAWKMNGVYVVELMNGKHYEVDKESFDKVVDYLDFEGDLVVGTTETMETWGGPI